MIADIPGQDEADCKRWRAEMNAMMQRHLPEVIALCDERIESLKRRFGNSMKVLDKLAVSNLLDESEAFKNRALDKAGVARRHSEEKIGMKILRQYLEMNIRLSKEQEILDLFRNDNPNDDPQSVFGPWSLAKCDGWHAVEIDGRPAGVIAYNSTPHSDDGDTLSTLEFLYVARAYRRSALKVGLRLCEFAIQRLAESERTPIYCDVSSLGMHATIKRLPATLRAHLYEVLSYQEYGDEWAKRGW